MIDGAITASILQEKAQQYGVRKVTRASYDVQIAIFRETLYDLDNYLDTSDLLKLTSTSLKVIRDDILTIIKGARDIKEKVSLIPVDSLDGALDELRLARDEIQVVLKMFNSNGEISESKVKKMLAEMRSARTEIEKALRFLEPR